MIFAEKTEAFIPILDGPITKSILNFDNKLSIQQAVQDNQKSNLWVTDDKDIASYPPPKTEKIGTDSVYIFIFYYLFILFSQKKNEN